MTYKETLFFVAKCLTVSLEEKNRKEIENQLKTTKIDWDAVVKLSTSHYVFPALYCNFKRVDFLKYIPEELVNYMEHITTLNRERNTQIITQAKEINQLLLENNITPIFLKGTGNLLEGLYEDIAERMVGDIDIIIDKNQIEKSNNLLIENGYKSKSVIFSDHRHLPRLIKEEKVAAIELHTDFLEIPHRVNFNFKIIKHSTIKLENNIVVLGEIDKLVLTILSNQITDNAYEKGTLLLRNLYDFSLLSKKTNNRETITKYPIYKEIINSYWAIFEIFFKNTEKIKTTYDKKVNSQIKKVMWLLNNPKLSKFYKNIKEFKIYVSSRFIIFCKAFTDKSNLKFIISRITSLEWFKRRILRIK